jgi:hypothetical protein
MDGPSLTKLANPYWHGIRLPMTDTTPSQTFSAISPEGEGASFLVESRLFLRRAGHSKRLKIVEHQNSHGWENESAAAASKRRTIPEFRFLASLACWAMLAAITPGCDHWRHQPATPGFMPSWNEARQSLESALIAWRDAPSPLPVSFSTRSVQFVHKRRKPNQRLLGFEFLGQSEIENARQFTVRLDLEGEESPQLVKYNIVGRDPVWVFRLEDYEMLSHWEHDMDPPEAEVSEKPVNNEQAR